MADLDKVCIVFTEIKGLSSAWNKFEKRQVHGARIVARMLNIFN